MREHVKELGQCIEGETFEYGVMVELPNGTFVPLVIHARNIVEAIALAKDTAPTYATRFTVVKVEG